MGNVKYIPLSPELSARLNQYIKIHDLRDKYFPDMWAYRRDYINYNRYTLLRLSRVGGPVIGGPVIPSCVNIPWRILDKKTGYVYATLGTEGHVPNKRLLQARLLGEKWFTWIWLPRGIYSTRKI